MVGGIESFEEVMMYMMDGGDCDPCDVIVING